MNFCIVGVTILVVAVPEGLPLAVTLSLAFSVGKMLKENNLVKHLDACETMGSATTICSDKTGTLTTNRMTVMKGYLGKKFFDRNPETASISKETANIVGECISLCSGKTTIVKEGNKDTGKPREYLGNMTECALLGMLLNMNISYEVHIYIYILYACVCSTTIVYLCFFFTCLQLYWTNNNIYFRKYAMIHLLIIQVELNCFLSTVRRSE